MTFIYTIWCRVRNKIPSVKVWLTHNKWAFLSLWVDNDDLKLQDCLDGDQLLPRVLLCRVQSFCQPSALWAGAVMLTLQLCCHIIWSDIWSYATKISPVAPGRLPLLRFCLISKRVERDIFIPPEGCSAEFNTAGLSLWELARQKQNPFKYSGWTWSSPSLGHPDFLLQVLWLCTKKGAIDASFDSSGPNETIMCCLRERENPPK